MNLHRSVVGSVIRTVFCLVPSGLCGSLVATHGGHLACELFLLLHLDMDGQRVTTDATHVLYLLTRNRGNKTCIIKEFLRCCDRYERVK